METYTREQVALVGYHMGWPGSSDPWYQGNPDQNYVRRFYYNVSAIPEYWLDGTENRLPSQPSFTSYIEGNLDRDVPYLITISAQYSGDMLDATVTLLLDEALPAAGKLHLALCETFVELSPPGPNGVSDYHYPMVAMSHNAQGLSVSSGASGFVTDDVSFELDPEWNPGNLSLVAFLQRSDTDEVLQAQVLDLTADTPSLSLVAERVDDAGELLPNGRPDPGEEVDIFVELSNQPRFLATDDLTGTLRCDDPAITFLDSVALWPSIAPGDSAENTGDPFRIAVPDPYPASHVSFTLDLEDASGYTESFDFHRIVGTPSQVLVNDYGDGMNVAEHWDQLLRDAAIVAEILPVDTALARGLGSYDHVIWATSTDTGDVITTAERDTITSYLNGGGRLLLISENAGEDEGDEAWFADAFAAEHGLDEMSGSSRVRLFGVEAGPFPEADIVLLGAEGAGNAQHQGSIAPLPAATPFFHYVSSEEIGGVGYQRDTGASAYLAFNLEAASGGDDSDPAPVILTTILTWLGDFSSQVPDGEASSARPSELHLAAHPNPFNSTVRLDFTLPTEGEVRLEVFDLLGRRVSLLLQERRGPGSHSASWSAEDLPSGIYLARLAGPSGASSVRKLVLVR